MNNQATVRKQLIVFWLLLVLLSPSVLAAADLDQTRHILLLNSYDQRMTWVKDIVRGVEDILQPDDNNISLHVENMNSKLFYSQEYFDIFREYLQIKYRDTSFSLILSSDNHAYDFLRMYRDKLFPGISVSICGVNNFQEEQIDSLTGFTGVAEVFSARETVQLALQLHPNATELYVINDYLKTGRAWARDIEVDLQEFEDRLTIRHAANLPFEDLIKEIAILGPNALVLLGVYYSDRDGRYFTYERIGAMLSEASNVPVYCLLEFNIGSGIVGGNVISGYYQGKVMAQFGVQILLGVDPAALPVVMEDSNRYVFDYRQLARFNVHRASLPAGSVIMHRPYSFYEEYKVQVWIVSGFIVTLLATILALIINTVRRMKAEGALRLSEERFRQLADAGWEAIVLHEKGLMFQANDLFFEMFGLAPEDLQGKEILSFIFIPGFVDKARERIAAGDLGPYEAIGHHKNGNNFPIEVRARVIAYKGRDIRVVAIRDLSERKHMEERLAQAQKMEAIGTLAGGIAHDFNNVLSVILGYADMAKEDAPPGTRFEKNLEQVVTAANRAADLVQQILAFSRQAEVERVPIKIQPLIKEGLKMLRSSIPTTISLAEDINPKTGTTLADPTQVHQILMNLCTNAYHAMEETGGALTITLKTTFIGPDEKEMVSSVNPGEYIEFTVSDTGSGIGPDIIGKIFDPYFTTKEPGKGTGMGLSIIFGIVSDYGGTITVDSKLGKGSTFHVYFPVVEEEPLLETKEPEDLPRGKERILFIDDEELLAEIGKDMLERLGYHVTVRRSSLEALSTFQNSPGEFDLVITDQTMPDMTGADLSRRMIQIRPDIPIILCTGYSNLIDEDSAKGMGIKEFALKPLTKRVIAKLTREVLDGSV